MLEFVDNAIRPYFNFWIYVILMMIGLWAVIAKNNYIKKLIGLSIFQTAIILFYVSIGVKEDATIPILHHAHDAAHESDDDEHTSAQPAAKDDHHEEKSAPEEKTKLELSIEYADVHHPDPDHIANPLPHVLMLTAIVVGVSTLGVALAISQMVFKEFDSLEEDEILEQLKASSDG